MGAFCSDCLKSITSSNNIQYDSIPSNDNNNSNSNNNKVESFSVTTTTTTNNNINKSSNNNTNNNKNIKIHEERNEEKTNHNNHNNDNNINHGIPGNHMTTNQIIPGFYVKYDLKEVIGVGSTANCHRCFRRSDGKEFACKVIDKRQIEVKFTGLLEQFYVEIKVLSELNHPNIIKLEDVFETGDRIYIVMELMSGGELFDYVVEKGTLSELEASRIVRKITSAVALMHSLGIIHRDLKPENLLLTSKLPNAEVKLIDFGLAKKISNDSVAHSFLGTRGYLAPEMLQRHTYDKAIDIWALGIIVFVLLCGCLPFDDDSSRIPSDSIAKKKFALRFPRWAQNLSPSAKDLLQKLLDVNPKTRITAEEAERHPWVRGEVAPDNYLTSPSILGERRKELKSPMTPHMQAMHNRLVEANNASNAQFQLNSITEETGGKKKDYGQANYGAIQNTQTQGNTQGVSDTNGQRTQRKKSF